MLFEVRQKQRGRLTQANGQENRGRGIETAGTSKTNEDGKLWITRERTEITDHQLKSQHHLIPSEAVKFFV